MLMNCRSLMDGPGPSEKVVEIITQEGTEEVVVNSLSIKGENLEVGPVLAKNGEFALIELPRESASGKWRVWVPVNRILETA